MYRLVYRKSDWLPRLAWCAQIKKNESEVIVHHGPWVETNESAFFEGAWSGDFEDFGFIDSVACCGSGGKLTNNGITFATPTHTCEGLQIIQHEEDIFVSNSLAFVLVKADDSYREDYPFYHHDFYSIIDGLDKYVRNVPTRKNRCVDLFYHCNVHINHDLSVIEKPKINPPAFSHYDEYVEFLRKSISEIVSNAASSCRIQPYRPLTSVSTGYDSPASSVLARECGCEEAITFVEARSEFPDRNDSGRRIGEKLGLRVRKFDSNSYRTAKQNFPEAEFLATGTGGEDVIMLPLEEVLPGRLFFVGFHGQAWAKHNKNVSSKIIRGDGTGNSLTEFRLRVGFIQLPVPYLGCTRHPSIHAISNSQEMSPWSFEQKGPFRTGYNRPIPRRLVEEAGIPREWFGQSKKAHTRQMVFPPRYPHLFEPNLQSILSEGSWIDFSEFMKNKPLSIKGSQRILFPIMRILYRLNRAAVWRVQRFIGSHKKVEESRFFFFSWRYQHPISEHMFLFHWGLQRTLHRYKKPDNVEK